MLDRTDTEISGDGLPGGMTRAARVTPERLESDLEAVRRDLGGAHALPPEGTPLRRLADSCLKMTACYVSDADSFISSGDAVTAFAAANYASEWLVCGAGAGLLSVNDAGPAGSGRLGPFSEDVIADRRMERYLGITSRARAKTAIAAPERSFGRRMAEWCLERSDSLYADAERLAADGDYVDSFAAVNRAHAWLDFGARAGLFDVGGDDVLFTLYE